MSTESYLKYSGVTKQGPLLLPCHFSIENKLNLLLERKCNLLQKFSQYIKKIINSHFSELQYNCSSPEFMFLNKSTILILIASSLLPCLIYCYSIAIKTILSSSPLQLKIITRWQLLGDDVGRKVAVISSLHQGTAQTWHLKSRENRTCRVEEVKTRSLVQGWGKRNRYRLPSLAMPSLFSGADTVIDFGNSPSKFASTILKPVWDCFIVLFTWERENTGKGGWKVDYWVTRAIDWSHMLFGHQHSE